ncbi:unnamed protein product [Owenia fusiformis]|uniref:Fatty acid synthase n=1 Tax=Owenia fusiformis TaxID=6347 RepID=A0A8S4P3V9_OWEFU|nr:unnamed protein product [Owenia fusiformis]
MPDGVQEHGTNGSREEEMVDPPIMQFHVPMSGSETSDAGEETDTNAENAVIPPAVTETGTWPGYRKIAIIGIGCRMPGDVNGTDAFWDVISKGKDTITDIPPDRWSTDAFYSPDQSKSGTHVTKRCGFIKGIDHFDHTFFKISPREAAMMDPQQRHTLEVTQEAFDDAGIDPTTLDKRCGVYLGIGMMDYPTMIVNDKNLINAYTHTGVAHSVAANRISYAFNLKGPSFAVDTACAASMTALHLACSGLWNKECEVAVVGGSNVLLTPEITVGFSQLGVLSPDGKSCPFDADAKGYVRSEGFGTLILKPLDDAIADGDHIYCSILGTAIGDNGQNQSITMPSTTEQLQMINTTYSRYNIPMENVSYVEAHGTGTPVGDPLEANAIGNAFRPHRLTSDRPLPIGSCKSNFGHMECTAGAVSTIKGALMLHNRILCPSTNFEKINPAIDLDSLGIKIQQEVEPLTRNRKHIMGINSFGFGGALAHAIIEEYTAEDTPCGSAGWRFGEDDTEGLSIAIPLSAKNDAGLIDLAKEWLKFKSEKDAQVIVSWLATRRPHYESRVILIANSGKDFRDKLQCFIDGRPQSSISGKATTGEGGNKRVCFVYPGQGQQWAKMGVPLYKKEKVYRDCINLCDMIFKKLSGWSLLEKHGVFTDQPKGGRYLYQVINDTDVSPPAIVFHQIALTKLWLSWGVYPQAVVGHSLGEVAAAFACGGITLEEAIAIALYRSEEQAKLSGNGGMAATRISEVEARAFCEKHDDIYVACVNSPSSTTIAGNLLTIEKLSKENPTTWKQLRVNCAYHTQYMEPVQEGFTKRLSKKLRNKVKPKIPMFSTVTGDKKTGGFDIKYWWDTIRKPVLFRPAVEKLLNEKFDVFVECGASATLLTSVKNSAQSLHMPYPICITSGQREQDNLNSMLTAVGMLHVNGVELEWGNITGNCQQWAPLPRYPWQHQTHWAEAETSRLRRLGLVQSNFKNSNGKISLKEFPFLTDHKVLGNVTFPGAGYIEYITQACIVDDEHVSFSDIKFKNVLVFGEQNKEKDVHLELSRKGDRVSISTGNTVHMEAIINTTKSEAGSPCQFKFEETESSLAGSLEVGKGDIYANFERVKLEYGPAFQTLQKVTLYDGKAVGVIQGERYHEERICSNILDGCFQLALVASQTNSSAYIPVSIGSLELFCPKVTSGSPLQAYAKVTDVNSFTLTANISVFSENVEVIRVTEMVAQNMDGATPAVDINECVYTTSWQPIAADLGTTYIANDIFNPKNLKEKYSEEMNHIESLDPYMRTIRGICASFARRALESVPEREYHERNGLYVARLKQIIKEDDVCLPIDEVGNKMRDIENACPAFKTEIKLFGTLGEMLPETLRNPNKAVEVLFGKEFLPKYFIDSLTTRLYYQTGSEIVSKAVDQALESKKIVRVLEVGGRMGGLAQYLLKPLQSLINDGKVEYTFTDLYSVFFPHAQQTLGEFSGVQYKELDIEQSVATQGFVPHTYDIVVCMDTLHSAVDLENGLSNMKDLLCPGGWLVMYEATNSANIAEITFGCLELCWVFDDFRKNTCWLDKMGWENLLENNGFKDVVGVSTPNEFFHSIIIGVKTDDKDIPASSNTVVHSEQHLDSEGWRDLQCEITSNRAALYSHVDSSCHSIDVIHLWENTSTLEDLVDIVKHMSNSPNCKSLSVVVEEDSISGSIPTGFLRVAVNEIKHLPMYTFRVKGLKRKDAMSRVIDIIRDGSIPDSEIMIENCKISVPRVMKSAIDNLSYRSLPQKPLSMGDIRIKVSAAGVNFKDVMMATGNLKDLNIAPQFGIECSGVITESHPSVGNVKVGDRVVAFANNCFASEVVCDSRLVAKVPKAIDIDVAAGMGIVFSTAYHALVERANIQEGETILIHSACGGVGQAAIQIASLYGAKIICSAGTDNKRNFLKEHYGIEHVTNSHSLKFVDDIMKWTANRGVDVVLNSLSGEYIKKGMDVLAHGGRFCEIGKRDILENSELELNTFLRNKSFLSVQLDVLMVNKPEKMTKLLEKVMTLLDNGDIKPVQTETRNISQYKETLRWMMTGQHIGKVALKIPVDYAPTNVLPPTDMFTDDGCYMVTGGLGGVGLAVARWLGNKGAKYIGLLSRHKASTFQQRCTIQHLENIGCKVIRLQADAGDKTALSIAIGSLEEASNKPLKGIFHLAGIIDDSNIQKLTNDQIRRTLNSKVDGARNLHELTQNKTLDHFVMFSSICTVIGNMEQGSYCAANAYLDKLAEHRRSVGLPSLSVQFGAIRGAGFLERNSKVTSIMETRGLLSLHINECITFLEKAMRCPTTPAAIGFSNLDWNLVQGMSHPRHMQFRHLQKVQNQGKLKCQSSREELQEKLLTKLSEILCTPVETIDINKPMTDYGIDSLMAVEMVQWINKELGLNMSQLDILGGISTGLLLDKALDGKVGLSG